MYCFYSTNIIITYMHIVTYLIHTDVRLNQIYFPDVDGSSQLKIYIKTYQPYNAEQMDGDDRSARIKLN